MIHVENLTKYYGDYAAVRDVSFDVAKGQVVGFLGPNGAGKSTTMRILTGYQTATSGKASIDGKDVFWDPIQARLMALSSFNEEIRGLQRLLVGHADEVDMDGAGRVLVPPALRQYAGLDHRVVLVGQGSKFELWDDAKWREQTARAITFPAGGLPPELDGFSL